MSETPAGLDVRPGQWAIVEAVLAKHLPDRMVWAFGSRIGPRAKPYSDLDLVVMGEAPLSLATRAALVDAFAESDLPWRVDLVEWATTSAEFRKIIAAHKLQIHTPHKP